MSGKSAQSDREAARVEPPGAAEVDGAIIGHSIRIQGDVTGDEDLMIQGYVDGSVSLNQHAVAVGPDGEVEADVAARVITVDGTVEGDLTAEERIVIRSAGHVEGDLEAPRVVLEDGARFRGEVRMDRAPGGRSSGGSSTSGSSRPAADTVPPEGRSGETAPEGEGDGDAGDDDADGA